MNIETGSVGFFGKLPTLGDFVTRRLPRDFIDPWDQWLQTSIRGSQEKLGNEWLSLFLVSPFWRFALSPGLCGNQAWAGVMMPSVDRVGRYYPLTLAQAVDAGQMAQIFLPESPWFARLENAALTVLDEPFELENFEQSLMNIHLPARSPLRRIEDVAGDPLASRKLLHGQLDSLRQSGSFFACLSQTLLNGAVNGYSFWATEGGQQGEAQLLCYQGMPSVDAYVGFLRAAGQSYDVALPTTYPVMQPSIDPPEADEPTIPRSEALTETVANSGQWQSHGITVVGNRRKHNEDAMLNAPELKLWVVADGMGGHQAGDVASQKIVNELAAMPKEIAIQQRRQWTADCLMRINGELCQVAGQLQPGAVIGSTVVAMMADAGQCAVIWAGDSRLYRLRDGQFSQITRDHTLLDELVCYGGMTPEDAAQQVGANVITRAVGGQEMLELDALYFSALVGDRYLLCSDGLDKELSEAEIAEGLAATDCRQAAEGLIDLALSRNAIDNITVVVVEYQSG